MLSDWKLKQSTYLKANSIKLGTEGMQSEMDTYFSVWLFWSIVFVQNSVRLHFAIKTLQGKLLSFNSAFEHLFYTALRILNHPAYPH